MQAGGSVMEDVWINIVIGILKSVTFIYDLVTYIPWQILDNPVRKLKVSRRIKVFTCIIYISYLSVVINSIEMIQNS